ncbi:hypothetical protein B0J11DRAFT_139001 [Dendryphion nanum]|uniref:Secreted protein n=1 Tax=Dendryphion nanum TaxID=256645 RepID=A0A9P9D6P0_9PLEO|nr:hypothetical protein B0J11DRAFT_139001 [Dendryphion nanum]
MKWNLIVIFLSLHSRFWSWSMYAGDSPRKCSVRQDIFLGLYRISGTESPNPMPCPARSNTDRLYSVTQQRLQILCPLRFFIACAWSVFPRVLAVL